LYQSDIIINYYIINKRKSKYANCIFTEKSTASFSRAITYYVLGKIARALTATAVPLAGTIVIAAAAEQQNDDDYPTAVITLAAGASISAATEKQD